MSDADTCRDRDHKTDSRHQTGKVGKRKLPAPVHETKPPPSALRNFGSRSSGTLGLNHIADAHPQGAFVGYGLIHAAMLAAKFDDGPQVSVRARTVRTSAQMQFNFLAIFGSQGAVNQIAQ